MTASHFQNDAVTIHHGDCLDVIRTLPDGSVDAIVTDPPYGLGFMGREWDALPPGLPWAQECLRVLKPGGHILAFGGSRTWHRLASAVEDAGFEIRDSIAWLYGSGFPKSLDVSKAIDKIDAAGMRLERARRFQAWLREHVTPQQVNAATGTDMGHHYTTHPTQPSVATVAHLDLLRPLVPDVPAWVEEMCQQRTVESQTFKERKVVGERTTGLGAGRGAVSIIGDSSNRDVTTAHTPEAAAWQGWGTALKPAFEPIVVGRKPLTGTVAENVLAHGTGALNIDGCRVATDEDRSRPPRTPNAILGGGKGTNLTASESNPAGRWPTNVVLDDTQAAALDQQSGVLKSGKMRAGVVRSNAEGWAAARMPATTGAETLGDSGGASRFFPTFRYQAKAPTRERVKTDDGVAHPTVKPLDLMRWLVRLVTPPGGVVLEPFAGSGTTVEACMLEGFRCVAIEREADYLPLIDARVARALELCGEEVTP